MIGNCEDFLMTILKCGLSDLEMIYRVNYEWSDILIDGNLAFNGINDVTRRVVEYGVHKISEAIDERISELYTMPEFLKKEELEELYDLKTLDPAKDINSYHNGIDTHVWIDQNEAVYQKYMKEALNDFEEGTGFHIEDDWNS